MAAWLPCVVMLAVLLPGLAYSGETNTVTASFSLEDIDGPVGSRTESLGQKIVEHLSNAIQDDPDPTLDELGQTAADGPLLSYSLVIDIDNPDANLLTPQQILANGQAVLFDFESGLQGWTLAGTARRLPAPPLGGDWGIFGNGRVADEASISLDLDLGDLAAIELEQFFLGEGAFEPTFLTLVLTPLEAGARTPALESFGLLANPDVRTVELGTGSGLHRITLGFDACQADECWFEDESGQPLRFGPSVGFLDNITFFPVPEPATIVLLGIAVTAWLGCSRHRSG